MVRLNSDKLGSKRVFQNMDYAAFGFVLLSFRPVFIALLGTSSMLFGFNTKTITTFFYLLIWFFFILGIWKNGIRPSREGGLFFSLIILIGILSIPFSPKQFLWNTNVESFITFNSSSYFHAALYIPLIFSIKDFSKLNRYLVFFARIFMLFVVLNDFFTINVLSSKKADDMMYSYGVVLLTCILIHDFAENKNRSNLYLALLGVLSALLSGTRGPLVCIAVCVFLSYINKISNKTSKLFFVLVLVAFVFLGGVRIALNGAANILSSIGFGDMRLVQYQEEGVLMTDSGRGDISLILWDAIVDNGFLGGGIGYDREILGVRYAHNIALEFLCDFGLFFGSVLLIVTLLACIRFFNSKNHDMKSVGIVLVSTVFVKLMFSSSFLIVFDFFLMLGLYYNNKLSANKLN